MQLKVETTHWLVDESGTRYANPNEAALEATQREYWERLRKIVPGGVSDHALRILMFAILRDGKLLTELQDMNISRINKRRECEALLAEREGNHKS